LSQLAGKFLQDASILLRKLAQNGAKAGDSILWTGTGWICDKYAPTIQSYTASTTVTDVDQDVILMKPATTVTTLTLTLFAIATTSRNRPLKIKNIGTGTVTVSSSDKMDGATTLSLKANNAAELMPSGGTWYIF
jgi:hypothetical protein